MEDGNVAELFKLALDLKAARRGNVLKIDPTEGAGNVIYGLDKFIDILCLDAQRESVDSAKAFEQHAFALHDRHTGLGADVAQPEHG